MNTPAISCLECRRLAPFSCAKHKPARPPAWSPARPTLPPVPKSRAAAATLREARATERAALLGAGFGDADVVALTAAIDMYDKILSSPAHPVGNDDADDDATADPAE